jgi:hypothetical protein
MTSTNSESYVMVLARQSGCPVVGSAGQCLLNDGEGGHDRI